MKEEVEKDLSAGMSRRNFLQAAGVSAATGIAAVALTGCTTSETVEETSETQVTSEPVLSEITPLPAEADVAETSYECDVVVVGGGWAGVSACRGMAEQGYSVILVDKAYPGWSGLSAWSNSYHWFDPEYDDEMTQIGAHMMIGDYASNLDWVKVWVDKSQEAYEKTKAWGGLEQFSNAVLADPDYDYVAEGDPKGYLQDYVGIGEGGRDRHWAFAPAIEEVAQLVPYTMITNVIVDEGRTVGAVGFNVHSAEVVSFACKAVIMCTGPGCYKPTGYPTGSCTWDGDYIAYNLGLKLSGKEWSDFHVTSNGDTGNVIRQWIGHHIQCNWETCTTGLSGGAYILWTPGYTGECTDGVVQYDPYAEYEFPEYSESILTEASVKDNGDIRGSDRAATFDTLGFGDGAACGMASTGMSVHHSEGVFNGNEATTATSIPGLYYAGDALSASPMGSAYQGKGFSSCMSCTQGYYAAEEAASYVETAEAGYITSATLAAETEAILAPMTRNQTEGIGYDACWIRDQVAALMSPAHISTRKTAKMLNAALDIIECIRDTYIPNLAANDGHELRMCQETKSRVLAAELKLRASLAREESRGRHYRADFPYRDDDNFLCSIVASKGSDGTVQIEKVPYNEAWIGDLTLPYEERYLRRFPGESEAMGLDEDTAASMADFSTRGTAVYQAFFGISSEEE